MISLDHTDNYLTNAQTRTMFSHVRTMQLEKICQLEGMTLHNVDWAQCLIAYKETPNKERFRDVLMEYLFEDKEDGKSK